jgi:energy-converting hydrogenase Eha subunit B
MKPSTLFLLLAVGLVLLPQTSQGQGIASPAFALFRPAPTPPPPRPASFIGRAPDYRWEGLVIGAIAGGVFVGTATYVFCSDPDAGGNCAVTTVAGTLVGGALGGFVGCLVGILIPKNHSASTH